MFEESTAHAFEFPSNPSEAVPEASIDLAPLSSELRPKSAKELANDYGVSDKSIQSWFKAVLSAYPWIAVERLKTGRSAKTRYLPLCQQLIAEYRSQAHTLSEEDWIASVHATHPEKLPACQSAQTSIPVNATIDSVPVLTTQKLTTLDQLAEKTGEMVPYRHSAVTLNGTQDEALDAIVLITERLEQMQKRNEEKRKALEARKQNLQKMDGVVGTLVTLGRSAEQEAFDLNDDVKDLKRDEADLKKRLAELLQTIS